MSHLIKIYNVCPLVFEFSILYSLDLCFEKLQTRISSSGFWLLILSDDNDNDHSNNKTYKGMKNQQPPKTLTIV